MPPTRENASSDPVLFVSYSHGDRTYVRRAMPHLRNVAESCGFDLFFDERDLQPGDSWRAEIEDHLRRARAAVVFLSSRYLDKDRFAASELEAILTSHRLGKLTCFVVPIDKVDPHLPTEFEELFEIQWALPKDRPIKAMRPKERTEAFRALNEAIGRGLKTDVAEPRTLEEFAKSQVQRTLDRKYRIGDCLGAGRSSVVFRAHDTALHRDVAIKVLVHARYEVNVAEEFVENAKVAARLRHQNIVQVLTSQLQSSPYYIVMECIDGPALDTVLKEKKGGLGTDVALRYFDQLASALARFHQQGMYHGAIRPSNILLDTTDPGGRAVLSVHWRRAANHRGDSGLTLEELTYLTPEEYVGGKMDEKTDQYQLGQLLYELLAGEPLAPRVTVLADFQRQQESFAAPVPPALVDSSVVGPRLRDAVSRMLNPDPKARWPSIEKASQAVRQAVAGIDPKLEVARASFDRCVANAKFFPAIYTELFALRSELEAIFHSRQTSFEHQYGRLRSALVVLFDAAEGNAAALRSVDDYGSQHAAMGVRPANYDDFLEAMIRAVRMSEGDTWNADLEDAWRASLAPGIERMKRATAVRDRSTRS